MPRMTRIAADSSLLSARLLALVLALVSVLLSGPAAAQDLATCRTIADNAARLRCFDGLDQAPAPTVAAPVPAAPSIAAPAPSVPVRPPSAAAAVPAPVPPVENFGAVAIPKQAPAEPKEITAGVIGSFDGVFRGMMLPLDNGQTWTVIDDREFEYVGKNPAVKLDRNLIGSYWMKILDGGPRFKVRRVK